MEQLKIYVVEDDPMYAKLLSYHLEQNPDYEVEVFPDGKSCVSNLYKNPIQEYYKRQHRHYTIGLGVYIWLYSV